MPGRTLQSAFIKNYGFSRRGVRAAARGRLAHSAPALEAAAAGGPGAGSELPRRSLAALLALLIAAAPASGLAFQESSLFPASAQQRLSSRATAARGGVAAALAGLLPAQPKEYAPPVGAELPYPAIRDNTEGAPAFADVLELLPRPRPGRRGLLLLDVGAGSSDAAKRFVEARRPDCRVLPADPYNRPAAENAAAQRAVEEAGGADVVTSMSVLNVVQEREARAEHLRLLRQAVRPGGLALFKVWAGFWPERGSGRPTVDEARESFQANAWASAFLPEVEEVFGQGHAYAENNLNLIVAVRDAADQPEGP